MNDRIVNNSRSRYGCPELVDTFAGLLPVARYPTTGAKIVTIFDSTKN